MKNIILGPTSSTPEIRFTTEGRLLMEGRSLPEDVTKFYNPLIEWVRALKTEVVKMDLKLEYLNSASSKKLLEILRTIDNNEHVKELIIDWHYESDDEDALENGEILEELLNKAEFRYHEYAEAV
jgi:hypothetical protein